MKHQQKIATEKNEAANAISEKKPMRKKNRFAGRLNKILNGEFLTREELINHLPFIGFLTGLFLLHISLMYFFENTQRNIIKKQTELNELRSQYNTTMSELETKKQQSNVAVEIEALGLKELHNPPQVINVDKGFMK